MNELYDKLELFLNHFVPSRKCTKMMKVGSKYKRNYDKAKTPYRRVLESSNEQISKKEGIRNPKSSFFVIVKNVYWQYENKKPKRQRKILRF